MCVTMKAELTPPELGPQQAGRSQSHDEQRNHALPIRFHAPNIG